MHDSRVSLSCNDQQVLDIQHSTMYYLGDRYEVGLLWKRDGIVLPNNRSMAVTCLNCLRKCFLNEPHLLAKYKAYIEKMVNSGLAIINKDKGCMSPRMLYLFHHCTSSKFQVVMNGVARFQGLSVNDCLLKGPEHAESLIGILLRFRQFRFTFMADI